MCVTWRFCAMVFLLHIFIIKIGNQNTLSHSMISQIIKIHRKYALIYNVYCSAWAVFHL